MAASPPPRRVLIADGSALAAECLRVLLSLWGFEVRVAADGRTATRLARDFRPDIVLVDPASPGLAARSLLGRQRRAAGPAAVRLVTASAAANPPAGGDAHLAKPIDPEELHSILGCGVAC